MASSTVIDSAGWYLISSNEASEIRSVIETYKKNTTDSIVIQNEVFYYSGTWSNDTTFTSSDWTIGSINDTMQPSLGYWIYILSYSSNNSTETETTSTSYTILNAPIDNDVVDDISGGDFIVDSDSNFRYIQTNNWPSFVDICGNNFTDYAANVTYGGNNVPEARDEYISIKIPVTPTYPGDGSYNYFTGEFADSTEKSYTGAYGNKNLEQVAMQMWLTCLLGRNFVANTHWSSTTLPKEIIVGEPAPAGMGGSLETDSSGNHNPIIVTMASGVDQEYDRNWVFSDSYYNNDGTTFVGYLSSQGTVDTSDNEPSGTYEWKKYRPGYYFRYNLPQIAANYADISNSMDAFTLDKYGGHVQPDGDWHFHLVDMFLDASFNNCVVGYAVDGTPIIGGIASKVYNSDGTEIGDASSSWIRRTDYSDSNAEDGQGYYHYDWIYNDSSLNTGTLDEFNGGYAYIDGNYQYSYFFTSTYPVWPRNIRGQVLDTETQIVFVSAGSTSSPYYNFTTYDSTGNIVSFDSTLYTDTIYTFRRENNATSHPFSITTSATGLTVTNYSNTDYSNNTIVVKFDDTFNSSTTTSLTWKCTIHDDMTGTFTVSEPVVNQTGGGGTGGTGPSGSGTGGTGPSGDDSQSPPPNQG